MPVLVHPRQPAASHKVNALVLEQLHESGTDHGTKQRLERYVPPQHHRHLFHFIDAVIRRLHGDVAGAQHDDFLVVSELGVGVPVGVMSFSS